MGDKRVNPDGTYWSKEENPSGMTGPERRDARRSDRKEAREQKHEDKKEGMTNKEAREDKHNMKEEDREKWKDGEYGIWQSRRYLREDEANALIG